MSSARRVSRELSSCHGSWALGVWLAILYCSAIDSLQTRCPRRCVPEEIYDRPPQQHPITSNHPFLASSLHLLPSSTSSISVSSSFPSTGTVINIIMQRHSFNALNSNFIVDSEYQFVKELGQGAYGCVVAAKHRRTGEGCAIKKITNINTKVCVPCLMIMIRGIGLGWDACLLASVVPRIIITLLPALA